MWEGFIMWLSPRSHRAVIDRRRVAAAALALLCLLLAGCAPTSSARARYTFPACASTGSPACAVGTGAAHLQVFVEPDAGVRPITDAIRAAHRSIWVEMYLLTDTTVINALEDAANQGLDVRVMLEPHPFESSPVTVQSTLEKLKAAGIKVNQTNPIFQLTHAKFLLLDGATLFLLTANLSHDALGGTKQVTNREYLLEDTETADVSEAQAIFTADWNRTTPSLSDPNLLVSPINARVKLLALIASARTSIQIENEETQDTQIENALAQAARRGVSIQVVLPAPTGRQDSNAAGVALLRKAGISVRGDKQYYIHAKLMLIDQTRAYVGSENISTASLDDNRELGLIVADPATLSTLATTFSSDYAISQEYPAKSG